MSKRNFLQNVAHKLVGSRGSTNIYSDQFNTNHSSSTSNFGIIYTDAASEVASNRRLVFFGEIHSRTPITAFQCAIQEEMSKQQSRQVPKIKFDSIQIPPLAEELSIEIPLKAKNLNSPTLHVIMEHFSFEMQDLLDDYLRKGVITDFDDFETKYHQVGNEGHDLRPYQSFLNFARDNKDRIRIHAGFIPRKYASILMKEGPAVALEQAAAWLPSSTDEIMMMLHGTSLHYNIFESLISGRFMYPVAGCTEEDSSIPSDKFRRIFLAQLLKDVAMAHKINQLIDEYKDDKFLVIAGNGHLLHYCGVPERVLNVHPELAKETCLVVSASTDSAYVSAAIAEHEQNGGSSDDVNTAVQDVTDRFGPVGANAADYVFLYEDVDEQELMEEDVKLETRSAYDKVGESAHLKGNALKAKAIMNAMAYTEEDFLAAGPDAYNFQGVGNPHIHAKIQKGERVLDIGSGLGIDSIIASKYAGDEGHVTGIDISPKQVRHAQEVATQRSLTNLTFQVADMEKLPFEDDQFDVVISNGAFCLAPNKEKALAEILRVLKPNGRIAVCTSTILSDKLEPGVHWPLCMKMFIQKDTIKPICEKVGFSDITIDDSDSSMTFELPVEVMEDTNPQRNKVHVGSPEFNHLENYDMDKICARVCIVARKSNDYNKES